MEMIKNLQINNYKSINQINLNCGRINVFVGEPNSGKSNILEALDLSYLSWLMHSNQMDKKAGYDEVNIKDLFRVDKVERLFHLGNLSQPISIFNDAHLTAALKFESGENKNIFEWSNSGSNVVAFDRDFNYIPAESTGMGYGSPIKPYRFKDNIQFHDTGNYLARLMPVHGNNISNVIMHNHSFQQTIKDFTEDYGFEINIDAANNQILIQIRINEGLVYSIPYKGIADTFKRFLFHIAAIRYSNGSVITLDEPDAHSFPKYVSFLADEIIAAVNQQFFIATHSPYLLNNLIENTPAGDLAVFVCGYDKNKSETIIKNLSQEDLSELIDYGVDIFFNINRYLDDRIEYSS